ncbi:hypothetical protein BJ878DRAFT_1199 [Calycina marina]|uniref:Uncharacterized protein n=1 Tax=Calycina marina TaxID=1763456 RepID=A0A9P7ZBY4_9HELO|nr:hypothetical protein BJ878DRAFT_1199 [Calycina marina]
MAPSKRFKTANWTEDTRAYSRSSSSSMIDDAYVYIRLQNLPAALKSTYTTSHIHQHNTAKFPRYINCSFEPRSRTFRSGYAPNESDTLLHLSQHALGSLGANYSLTRHPAAGNTGIGRRHTRFFGRPIHDLLSESLPTHTIPVDAIHSELLVLAALVLAVKFVDDAQVNTSWYVREWGNELWSCAQLNFCQTALMDDIGWRLLHLWDDGMIANALRDMKMAGRQCDFLVWDEDELDTNQGEKKRVLSRGLTLKDMGHGKAVTGLGT